MIEESEILSIIIYLLIILIILLYRKRFSLLKYKGVLLSAVIIFFIANIFTIMEGFVWETYFNILEHFFYMAGAVTLLVWLIMRTIHNRKNKNGADI
ncbi:MAG: hypothetical protein R6U31_04505 [bacterium]